MQIAAMLRKGITMGLMGILLSGCLLYNTPLWADPPNANNASLPRSITHPESNETADNSEEAVQQRVRYWMEKEDQLKYRKRILDSLLLLLNEAINRCDREAYNKVREAISAIIRQAEGLVNDAVPETRSVLFDLGQLELGGSSFVVRYKQTLVRWLNRIYEASANRPSFPKECCPRETPITANGQEFISQGGNSTLPGLARGVWVTRTLFGRRSPRDHYYYDLLFDDCNRLRGTLLEVEEKLPKLSEYLDAAVSLDLENIKNMDLQEADPFRWADNTLSIQDDMKELQSVHRQLVARIARLCPEDTAQTSNTTPATDGEETQNPTSTLENNSTGAKNKTTSESTGTKGTPKKIVPKVPSKAIETLPGKASYQFKPEDLKTWQTVAKKVPKDALTGQPIESTVVVVPKEAATKSKKPVKNDRPENPEGASEPLTKGTPLIYVKDGQPLPQLHVGDQIVVNSDCYEKKIYTIGKDAPPEFMALQPSPLEYVIKTCDPKTLDRIISDLARQHIIVNRSAITVTPIGAFDKVQIPDYTYRKKPCPKTCIPNDPSIQPGDEGWYEGNCNRHGE